jgi:hypothetical protein
VCVKSVFVSASDCAELREILTGLAGGGADGGGQFAV